MRDITQLHPELQDKLTELQKKCEKKGLKIKITECLRTMAEQDALYAQGRTKPGKIVTNAKGSTYSSMHMWGVAADFCRNDGKGAYEDSDGFFAKVGKIGQSIGLEWGGSWKSIVDKPHFQLPQWGSTTTVLKQKYGTPEKFKATWPKPDPDDKYGKMLVERKMQMVKEAFVRYSPEVNKNKVPFDELSAAMKKKCRKTQSGNAVFLEGSKFSRIRSYTDKSGNKWHQLKSKVWVPVVYDSEQYAKEVE